MRSVREHFDTYAESYEEVLNFPIISNFIRTRDKEVETFLKGANGTLLDVGVGTGYYLVKFSRKFRKIVVLDISKKMLEVFRSRIGKRENIEMKLGSVKDFESRKKFDAILCVGVFNYAKQNETSKIIRKFYRLLKTNGSVLITFPDKNNVFGKIYSAFWNARGVKIKTFTKREVLDILRKEGFKDIEIKDKSNNMPTFHLIAKAKK